MTVSILWGLFLLALNVVTGVVLLHLFWRWKAEARFVLAVLVVAYIVLQFLAPAPPVRAAQGVGEYVVKDAFRQTFFTLIWPVVVWQMVHWGGRIRPFDGYERRKRP